LHMDAKMQNVNTKISNNDAQVVVGRAKSAGIRFEDPDPVAPHGLSSARYKIVPETAPTANVVVLLLDLATAGTVHSSDTSMVVPLGMVILKRVLVAIPVLSVACHCEAWDPLGGRNLTCATRVMPVEVSDLEN